MYLGIDFLITPRLMPFVSEVNIGLPGGAQEYELTHKVYLRRSSFIFEKIERTSQEAYGKSFQHYLHSLPFIESLKPFKIWMDGMGPFPKTFHPGLRLEDKWIQYQILKAIVPIPETMTFDPRDLTNTESFMKRKGRLVLKRRLGRGGRNFKILNDLDSLYTFDTEGHQFIVQEYLDSMVDGYVFSVRAVAFGGEFVCMYANLSSRSFSNHGILTFVSEGECIGLAEREFETESFNQRSWEAEIWFGEREPAYLRHNLYEDEVSRTTLRLPPPLYETIQELSVKIERYYEGLNLSKLPKACFEKGRGFCSPKKPSPQRIIN